MNPVQFDRPGVWRDLFASALTLTDHLATVVKAPKWSFGGGTVLMLRLDVVVGTPLTDSPWEVMDFQGRRVCVETCAEIVAKKMWYRGDQAKARDLFDLCAVADLEPAALDAARPFMARHSKAFLARLNDYRELTREEFSKIDRIAYTRSFDECMDVAERLLN